MSERVKRISKWQIGYICAKNTCSAHLTHREVYDAKVCPYCGDIPPGSTLRHRTYFYRTISTYVGTAWWKFWEKKWNVEIEESH